MDARQDAEERARVAELQVRTLQDHLELEEQKFTNVSSERDQLLEKTERLKLAVLELEADESALQEREHRAEVQEKLESVMEKLVEMTQRASNWEDESEREHCLRLEAETELSSLRERVLDIQRQKEELEDALERLDSHKATNEALKTELKELRRTSAVFDTNLDTARMEHERMQRDMEDLRKQLEDAKNGSTRQHGVGDELEARNLRIAQLEQAISELHKNLSSYEERQNQGLPDSEEVEEIREECIRAKADCAELKTELARQRRYSEQAMVLLREERVRWTNRARMAHIQERQQRAKSAQQVQVLDTKIELMKKEVREKDIELRECVQLMLQSAEALKKAQS